MQQVREWLRAASSIAVLTGAGISAESGVPTFRGPGGLWRTYRAEDLATPGAFQRDPRLVWEWYNWRRSVLSNVQPNAGHLALVELEKRTREFAVITQNVDGLHERAGNRRIFKLHGDIWTVRCTRCGLSRLDPRPSLEHLPPHCACGAMERPGVVWFGESLPTSIWQDALNAASNAQVLLVVGTSAIVYPAAGLASIARRAGAKVVEVNIEETPISNEVDCVLRGSSADILPRLLA
jgi:NAD-dependent deacetylase